MQPWLSHTIERFKRPAISLLSLMRPRDGHAISIAYSTVGTLSVAYEKWKLEALWNPAARKQSRFQTDWVLCARPLERGLPVGTAWTQTARAIPTRDRRSIV